MNMAILEALYKAAQEAFIFCKLKPGNYTAAELARMEKGKGKEKRLKWKDEEKRNELRTVTLGAFTCSFPLCQSFALVVKFERLCSAGKAKQKTFTRKDGIKNVCASVTVEVNKTYKSLADYAEDSKGLRPVLQCVCLDVVNGRAVATDGHVMRIMPIPVISSEGTREGLRPLVSAEVWRNMCEKAGKEGAEVCCKLVEGSDGEKWICEGCGLTSEVYAGRFPDYIKVVPEVSPSHVLRLTQESLRALKSLIKGVKGKKDITTISHEEGGCNITVTCEHEGKKNAVVLPCLVTPGESYTIYTNAKAWYKDFKDFAMYIGRSNNRPQVLVDGNALTLVMPLLPEDATLYNIDYTDGVCPFALAGLDYRPLNGATDKEESPEGVTCTIERQPQEAESTKDTSSEINDYNMNELKADKKSIEPETVESVGSVEAITDDVQPVDETRQTATAVKPLEDAQEHPKGLPLRISEAINRALDGEDETFIALRKAIILYHLNTPIYLLVGLRPLMLQAIDYDAKADTFTFKSEYGKIYYKSRARVQRWGYVHLQKDFKRVQIITEGLYKSIKNKDRKILSDIYPELLNALEALEASTKQPDETKAATEQETTKEVAAQPEAKAKKERKAVTPLEREAKKFTLAKVGIKAGDVLNFVDGTEVVATDDNKVIYEGKAYTLSGFCKSFLPDRMRNKANAYRGCEYFYKDGVRLGKLFKSRLMFLEVDGKLQELSEKAACLAIRASKEARHIVTPNGKESAAETKQIGFWNKLLRKAHRFAACFSL